MRKQTVIFSLRGRIVGSANRTGWTVFFFHPRNSPRAGLSTDTAVRGDAVPGGWNRHFEATAAELSRRR